MRPPGYTQADAEFDDGYNRYDPDGPADPPRGCTDSFRAGWRMAQAEDVEATQGADPAHWT